MTNPYTPDYTQARDLELRALFLQACPETEPALAFDPDTWPTLVSFAKAVAAAEREACAQECEQIADESDMDWGNGRSDPSDTETALYCAAVIRRRAVIDQ